MTMRLEGSVEIARPADEVFRFVADPRNDPAWCPRVDWCRLVEGDREGALYEAHHHPTLQQRHLRRIEVLELDSPRRAVTRQEDAIAVFRITYALSEMDGGTRLTQIDEIDWKVAAPARPVARLIVSRHIGSQLRSLKRLLEGAPVSRSRA